MNIVLATGNHHKIAEFRMLLAGRGLNCITTPELGYQFPLIEETGDTLLGNARLKAMAIAKLTQHPALADDTGLEVEYLKGRPGVYSARYAGPAATMKENRAKLLNELEGVPESQRGAKFVCQLCLVATDGEILAEFSGEVTGSILTEPRGDHGFGYDSLFWIDSASKTLAELNSVELRKFSHRARAVDRLVSRESGERTETPVGSLRNHWFSDYNQSR